MPREILALLNVHPVESFEEGPATKAGIQQGRKTTEKDIKTTMDRLKAPCNGVPNVKALWINGKRQMAKISSLIFGHSGLSMSPLSDPSANPVFLVH